MWREHCAFGDVDYGTVYRRGIQCCVYIYYQEDEWGHPTPIISSKYYNVVLNDCNITPRLCGWG